MRSSDQFKDHVGEDDHTLTTVPAAVSKASDSGDTVDRSLIGVVAGAAVATDYSASGVNDDDSRVSS